MNYPSVKTLVTALRITEEQAKLVRGVMMKQVRVTDNGLFPETNKWLRLCFNPPSGHDLRMSALNEVIGGFGVEVLGDVNNYPPDIQAEYINTGDTYSATIIYRDGRYFVGCWGDLAEKLGV